MTKPRARSATAAGVQDTLIDRDVVLQVLHRVNVLAEADRMSIDIGGSLAKLLYIQANTPNSRRLLVDALEEGSGNNRTRNRSLSFHVPMLGGTAHFFSFETRNIEELVHFLVANWGGTEHVPRALRGDARRTVRATGGGAYKYAAVFERETGCQLRCLDEMQTTVAGLNFLLTRVEREVYTVRDDYPDGGADKKQFKPTTSNPFPYLLVNIGSGVSVVRVTGHNEFTRVSGSALGGGTFWGLARLLTNCKTFDEIIELTKGAGADNANVDMLVRDIYAGDYKKLGLDGNIVAASFGRVTMRKEPAPISPTQFWKNLVRAIVGTALLWFNVLLALPVIGHVLRYYNLDKKGLESVANRQLSVHFSARDVALSLLRMVSYNIGQIAYLNAQRFNLERIYFGGNFIRNHPFTIAAISFSVRFWSGGKTEALFLNHDGFLGTLGAFILGDPRLEKVDGDGDLADSSSESRGDADGDTESSHASSVRGPEAKQRGPESKQHEAPTRATEATTAKPPGDVQIRVGEEGSAANRGTVPTILNGNALVDARNGKRSADSGRAASVGHSSDDLNGARAPSDTKSTTTARKQGRDKTSAETSRSADEEWRVVTSRKARRRKARDSVGSS